MLPNYIESDNPFSLAGPPNWWLAKLWHFDSSLVVIPSKQQCLYRLAQRRPPNIATTLTNDSLFKDSDTRMLASHGLIPVTSILATANWSNPFLFEELRRRAPWRLGGAEKVNADLDMRDQQDELDKRAAQDDINTQVARDGWNLYNKKIGVRSHMYIPNTKRSDFEGSKPSKAPVIILARG